MLAIWFWLTAAAVSQSGEAEELVVESRPSEAPDEQLQVESGAYRVGVGDVLEIRVYQEEDLTGLYLVGDSGEFEMPLLGAWEAEGLTTRDLSKSIEVALKTSFLVNPQVSVRVETYASQPVQVLGAVKNPGMIYLTGPTTLQEILAKAGGVVSDLSAQEVVIKNESNEVDEQRVVNLDRLFSTGEGNVVIQGGDLVYVSEGQSIYVGGQVGKPGRVPYVEGLTVTQALVEAGGAKDTANLREAYVLRDGGRQAINIRRILQGRDTDFTLQHGDQLFVEESVW